VDPELVAEAERLAARPYRSAPRILIDVALWTAAAWAAARIDRSWVTAIAVVLIGAVPLHDLLVLGHEGSHGLLARRAWLNEALSWFALGTVGISRVAHREFHQDHHRAPHQAGDPEYELFASVVRRVPGWSYLVIPLFATVGINSYPFRAARPAALRRLVLLDVALAALLHAALLFALGARHYLVFIVAPMFTGLLVATLVRSICEHHAVPEGEARSIAASRLIDVLWSNVNYHDEHHRFPGVPCAQLPSLRRLLGAQVRVERGYLRTTIALLKTATHFTTGA
jgi:fatty acid desaturase